MRRWKKRIWKNLESWNPEESPSISKRSGFREVGSVPGSHYQKQENRGTETTGLIMQPGKEKKNSFCLDLATLPSPQLSLFSWLVWFKGHKSPCWGAPSLCALPVLESSFTRASTEMSGLEKLVETEDLATKADYRENPIIKASTTMTVYNKTVQIH